MRWAEPGAAYVPFIGDGDLAVNLYRDRMVFGADLDRQRVRTAAGRLPSSNVIVADCDGWPFAGEPTPFAIADFDAYVNPYLGFRAFWPDANKTPRMVLFFTDGIKQAVVRSGIFSKFDGTTEEIPHENLTRKRQVYNAYLSKYVWPDFEDFIHPWRVVDRMRYLRASMTYWGCVIEYG